jgi:hypothetical protein
MWRLRSEFSVCCSFVSSLRRRSARRRACLVVQHREQMLMLHSSRDEFSAGASHLGEEPFTSLIDERDLFQVDDRVCQGRPVARVLPARAQFIHPGAREAPMQAPTLPVGCIGITDSKHIGTPFRSRRNASSVPKARHSFCRAFARSRSACAAELSAEGVGFRQVPTVTKLIFNRPESATEVLCLVTEQQQ